MRALVVLAALSGLRSGELLGLSVDRVDFLRREVKVDRQLQVDSPAARICLWLSAGGVPFTTVMELLGHAPQGVTWSTYTHGVDGRDRQVREVLEQAWAAKIVNPADSVRTAEGS